jgi:hypothetical protein
VEDIIEDLESMRALSIYPLFSMVILKAIGFKGKHFAVIIFN